MIQMIRQCSTGGSRATEPAAGIQSRLEWSVRIHGARPEAFADRRAADSGDHSHAPIPQLPQHHRESDRDVVAALAGSTDGVYSMVWSVSSSGLILTPTDAVYAV